MVMNPMVESKTQENEQITDWDTSDSDPCGGNGIIAPFKYPSTCSKKFTLQQPWCHSARNHMVEQHESPFEATKYGWFLEITS